MTHRTCKRVSEHLMTDIRFGEAHSAAGRSSLPKVPYVATVGGLRSAPSKSGDGLVYTLIAA